MLITDHPWPRLDREQVIFDQIGARIVVATTGDEDELYEIAPHVDAILTCWKPVTERVLMAARRCVTVGRYGVGLDNIDVAAATKLGIIVSNVPDFCTDEVADHTMALLLAHARRIVALARLTADGAWDNRGAGPMHRLRGQTLGLIGFGRTARAVAQRAAGFGLRIQAYTPSRAGASPEAGVRFATDLDDLLATSDIVSLHVPLHPGTRGLIGRPELARMAPHALLVNTARGALVDEGALLEAVRAGRIGGAALDVLCAEPPEPGSAFLREPRVIVTPHAAFDSVEAVGDLQDRAASNVARVLTGGVPDTVVNMEVLRRPQLRSARSAPAQSR